MDRTQGKPEKSAGKGAQRLFFLPYFGKRELPVVVEIEGKRFVASIGSGYPLPYFRPPALRRVG